SHPPDIRTRGWIRKRKPRDPSAPARERQRTRCCQCNSGSRLPSAVPPTARRARSAHQPLLSQNSLPPQHTATRGAAARKGEKFVRNFFQKKSRPSLYRLRFLRLLREVPKMPTGLPLRVHSTGASRRFKKPQLTHLTNQLVCQIRVM